MAIGFDKRSVVGIRISESVRTSKLFQEISAHKLWEKDGFSNVQKLILQHEVGKYPASTANILREELTSVPGVGPATERTVVETRNITDSSGRVTNSILDRSRESLAITPLMWIPGFIICADQSTRQRYLRMAATKGIKLPQLHSEYLKRTRRSTLNNLEITPKLNLQDWRNLVNKNPELKDTFFDPDLLDTETGMAAYFDFLNLLQMSEGNYIKFVDYDKRQFPELDAKTTTTFGAITVDESRPMGLSNIYVLQGGTYPNNIVPATHIVDAIISGPVYITSTGTIERRHRLNAEMVNAEPSTASLTMYIVERAIGDEPNPSRRPDTSTPPLPTPQNQAPANFSAQPVTNTQSTTTEQTKFTTTPSSQNKNNKNRKRDVSTSAFATHSNAIQLIIPIKYASQFLQLFNRNESKGFVSNGSVRYELP